jgi:dihydrofolate reductase
MRKVIASINMSLDGFCDHTAMIPDDELLQHFNDLFRKSDTILYGRITYKLMEDAWPAILKNPTGNKSFDEFAVLIDSISKIVFSTTLKNVEWNHTTLVTEGLKEEVLKLKQQSGGNILAGSRSIIVALMQLDLIDEYQLCVQPSVLGKGLPLFNNIQDRIDLGFLKTRPLSSGIVILHYKSKKK